MHDRLAALTVFLQVSKRTCDGTIDESYSRGRPHPRYEKSVMRVEAWKEGVHGQRVPVAPGKECFMPEGRDQIRLLPQLAPPTSSLTLAAIASANPEDARATIGIARYSLKRPPVRKMCQATERRT